MIEVFDLSFNLTVCLEPTLTAGFECSQNSGYMHPTDPIWGKYDLLEQKI